jgi:hypothetical protein
MDTKYRYSLFAALESLCDHPEDPPLVSIYQWFTGRLEREKPGRELQRLYSPQRKLIQTTIAHYDHQHSPL